MLPAKCTRGRLRPGDDLSFPGTDLDRSIPQRTTTYVSRTAAVARAAMRTRCLRSQIRCIRCQSAAPSATRLASGTKTKIDATEIRTQIASAVSRIARPGVCQQSQVWIPRNRLETEYQTGITFPSARAERLSIFNCDSGSSRDAQGSRMQIQKTRRLPE
jgi:hypothetical protein